MLDKFIVMLYLSEHFHQKINNMQLLVQGPHYIF